MIHAFLFLHGSLTLADVFLETVEFEFERDACAANRHHTGSATMAKIAHEAREARHESCKRC